MTSGFMAETTTVRSPSKRKPEDECTAKLANALRQKHLSKAVKTSNWQYPFAKLLKSRGRIEVDEVLNWYCQHVGEEFVPTAMTAKTFCTKFDQIKRAMRRISPSRNAPACPDCKLIYEDMRQLDWPGPVCDSLSSAIEESMKSYRKFHDRVKRLTERWNKSPPSNRRLKRFLDYLLELRLLSSPPGFLRMWFQSIHDSGWAKNAMSAESLVFSESSYWLRRLGYQWAQDYSHSVRDWDLLLEEIR